MTTLFETRKPPSAVTQWWVLTCRVIAPSLRNGEVFLAIISPVFFTVAIYLPLAGVMQESEEGSNYAQFIMPMLILQGAAFSSITAAFRSATDQVEGINRRFAAMPIAAWCPVASRMAANTFRASLAILSALICGYIIGFRFYISVVHSLLFILVAISIAVVLALIADILGSITKSPEAVSQAIIIPQMFFGLLSSGFAPEGEFPSWIGPFIRYQPISQFSELLRALAGEDPNPSEPPLWSELWPGLAWLVVLIALLTPWAIRLNSRRG